MFILQLNREGIKSTIDDSYRTCHKVRSITDQVVNGTIQIFRFTETSERSVSQNRSGTVGQ